MTAKDMTEFLEYIDHPLVHICWDVGHANMDGTDHYAEIMQMGKNLKAIHVHDNDGINDQHIAPFFGTADYDSLMKGLIDSGYEGYFTLECSSSLIPKNYWLGGRRSFDGNAQLAEPQLFMQQQVVTLMYSIAKYMLTAYDIFEE